MTPTSKVTIHMVSSLDGFIAKKDGSVSWLETADSYEKGITLTDEAVAEFLKTIDCYVMGSRTYELALKLGWPYGDVPTIVLTHRDLPVDRRTVEFYSGDLSKLVNDRLRPNYKNIWVVGGAALTKDFIRLKLADEIRQTIAPVILGDGIPFFDNIGQEQALHLKDATAYNNGFVELCYEIPRKGVQASCPCRAVGRGVQTFRIRDPESLFDVVADVGSDRAHFMDARAVWACRTCGQRFAWMRIPYKDHEEILVRAESSDWQNWDWIALAEIADSCRWRGPDLDERYVV
jgi:dihydrofolate reductase